MNAILRNPQIRQAVDSFMAQVVPSDWPATRRGAAQAWLEGIIVRACELGAAGAHAADDRSASVHAFGLALALAKTIDPVVATRECPDDPAAGMQAMLVAHLAGLRDGRDAA